MIGASVNPTTLTVGRRGTLDGRSATVVGRAVLQSADGYRWDEYYVQLESGRMIILVYEAGDWKRFEEFTPKRALTADQAEAYRVGASLELNDKRMYVRYVSTSRVRYSEGTTWDGVRQGSAAYYFNAETDDHETIVVSWTGREIEFYLGRKLSSFTVPHAFGLPRISFWKRFVWGGSGSLSVSSDSSQAVPWAVVLVIAGFFLVFAMSRRASLPTVDPPPVAGPLSIELHDGVQGVLAGNTFVIRGRALVEIDEQPLRFKRYEYDLADARGDHALLVENLNGDVHEWVLFRAVNAPAWLIPNAAAILREGGVFHLEGREIKIERVLLSRWLAQTGSATDATASGAIRYGFLGKSGDTWVLARWDERTLELMQGQSVSESAALGAFAPSSVH